MLKKQVTQLCPLCGKIMKTQDVNRGVYWCPTPIKFQGGKQKFHYVVDLKYNSYEMIVMPYKINTYNNYTQIAIHIPPNHPNATPAYKSGLFLFKNICKTIPILPMNANKLLNKIKLIVMLS
jgi:hypothetical protein